MKIKIPLRIIALWRLITCKKFIVISYNEKKEKTYININTDEYNTMRFSCFLYNYTKTNTEIMNEVNEILNEN